MVTPIYINVNNEATLVCCKLSVVMLLPTLFVVFLVFAPMAHSTKEYGDSDIKLPLIHTPEGLIRGSFLTTYTGTKFYSFRGVRFAEPPIGKNRFEVKYLIFTNFWYETYFNLWIILKPTM